MISFTGKTYDRTKQSPPHHQGGLLQTKWAFSYRSPSMRISYASYANCSLPAYGDELSEVLHDATNLHPQNGVIVLGGISNGVGGLSTRYGL